MNDYTKRRLEKEWTEYATKLVLANANILFVDIQSLIKDWWLSKIQKAYADGYADGTKMYKEISKLKDQ